LQFPCSSIGRCIEKLTFSNVLARASLLGDYQPGLDEFTLPFGDFPMLNIYSNNSAYYFSTK
jgi:hypothetical protein